jgi:hypothetical protein
MEELVSIARKTIEDFFKTGKLKIKLDKKFQDKRGVFVTIHSYPDNELRGCVGFTTPEYSLYEAVQKASIEAAFHDNRFLPLTEDELDKVVFEVSILSLPEVLNGTPDKRIEKIEKDKDGLIIEYGIRKGLFLPQVWEDIQDKKQFLEALCWKAGLTPDYVFDKNTKLYKFNVKAFKEVEPKGKIIEIGFKKK